jgi:hypothetical protein
MNAPDCKPPQEIDREAADYNYKPAQDDFALSFVVVLTSSSRTRVERDDQYQNCTVTCSYVAASRPLAASRAARLLTFADSVQPGALTELRGTGAVEFYPRTLSKLPGLVADGQYGLNAGPGFAPDE